MPPLSRKPGIIKKLPLSKRVTWRRYQVQSGDSLGRIAHIFKTSVVLLQEVNILSGTLIHPGQILLIPRNASNLLNYNFRSELKYATQHQLKLGPKKLIITVNVGDSLWSIAEKYHINCRWNFNRLSYVNHIRI